MLFIKQGLNSINMKLKKVILINWGLSFFGLCVDTEGPFLCVIVLYVWFLVSSVLVIGMDRWNIIKK